MRTADARYQAAAGDLKDELHDVNDALDRLLSRIREEGGRHERGTD